MTTQQEMKRLSAQDNLYHRDLHGPDSDGPARPVVLKARPVTARGPELSLGPGPFRPVACPVWPGPSKAVSKGFLETIQYIDEFY